MPRTIAMLVFFMAFSGCGEEIVVFENSMEVECRRPFGIQVQPGTYRIEMTASENGARINFEGTKREPIKNSRQFGGTVLYTNPGTIQIDAAGSCLGATSQVHLKITKIK
jgi:hypothetical protein